jgi:hypothetical protein
MHRTACCDLDEPGTLVVVEIAQQRDAPREHIVTLNTFMIHIDRDLANRPTFAVCVHAQGHRGARSERSAQ